ncbi:MAG: DUF5916 domain-containing protein [Pseudomonadales bacterium]
MRQALSKRGCVRWTVVATLLTAASAMAGAADQPDPARGQLTDLPLTPPGTPPVASATALTRAPTLDGRVLNDPAWAGVQPATGFWQVRPFEGQPASQRTEVYLGYTESALYVGVVCYDDDPAGIIVADSRRDSSLEETDSFQVVIDAFRDRQNGFVFGTNPAGIEYDGQVTKEGSGQFGTGSGGFNLNWDTSWSVKTAITGIGWIAEMEIPFKSLRYGRRDEQVWGINFQRNIRRNNEVAFWSPLSRQHEIYRVSDAGTLLGIEVPSQRNLKLMPYLLGRANRGGELDGTHYGQEVGADLKYSLTPSLTLDLTWNTDFAQVEADDLVVNLDRFSVFFPEKRPFFLENAGLFAVGTPQEVELFFSRRIGISASGAPQPIEGGARVSGKLGDRTNVGALLMRTESVNGVAPETDFAVARISQELPNRSAIGALIVERDGGSGTLDDDHNLTYAIDGRLGIGNDGLITGFLAKTETPGMRGDDHAYSLIAQHNSERWSNSLGFTEVAENFNPEVGFLRRRDYRKAEARIFRRIRPDDLWGLHELRPHVAWNTYWKNDGYRESSFLHIDNHWEWRSGHEIHTGVNFTYEGVQAPFEIVDGVFVEPGRYDNEEAQLVFITNQGAPLSAELTTRIGGFFSGDRVSLEPTLSYRIGETFTSELSWNHNDIDLPVPGGDFRVNVGRLRLSYSFTPKILLQALVQYDDRSDLVATNLRFSWLQTANAGLFLVYNEIDDDSIVGPMEKRREIVLKYSRIFDL